MKDELGERIKSQYEHRTRFSVPRRTYTIIRLDGKAFHTYTKGLEKPFDINLIEDMDKSVVSIMSEIQGAQFAYVQSDEISILLTDFEKPTTDAWFDGNIQKIVSVSASLITAEFNKFRTQRFIDHKSINVIGGEYELAYFDSRVFTIPDPTEVMNYFIWRNNDAARNSVSMVAQSLYSHKELQSKSTVEMQEMIFQKGINWSTYNEGQKNGRLVVKEHYHGKSEYLPDSDKSSLRKTQDVFEGIPSRIETYYPLRSRWVIKDAWKFTQDKEKLMEMIPKYN